MGANEKLGLGLYAQLLDGRKDARCKWEEPRRVVVLGLLKWERCGCGG